VRYGLVDTPAHQPVKGGASEIPNRYNFRIARSGAGYVRAGDPRPDLGKAAVGRQFAVEANPAGEEGSLCEQGSRNTLLVFRRRANGQRYLPRNAAGATGLPQQQGRARSGDARSMGGGRPYGNRPQQ